MCSSKGPGTVCYKTEKRWFNCFRNGDYSFQDDQRSSRPSEIDLTEFKKVNQTKASAILRASPEGAIGAV